MPESTTPHRIPASGTRRPGRLAASLCAVLLASVVLSACGSASAGREPAFAGERAPGLTITIRNQRTQDIRFWIWIDGRRETLGTVQSTATRTFRARIDRIADVRLEFDITLGARCMTRSARLEPGVQLDLTIPVNLRLMDVRCG